MKILQLVPSLPPPLEGVGTYAMTLAHALCTVGFETSFLAASESRWRDLSARLEERSSSSTILLLHYANYGFQARGCPFWLDRRMRRWRRRSPRRRLATIFHEVYATGTPWQSSFWLSPVQRRLAANLARASDRIVTSLDLYRSLLAHWVPAAAITVLPVFSTVGEVLAPLPLTARHRRLIVFGGPGGRARTYSEHGKALAAAVKTLGIQEIADIGPGTSGSSGLAEIGAAVDGVPVRRMGELPAAQVSALMAESLAGFVAHRPAFLGKSTVFAAYCAHGMLPVASEHDPNDSRLWVPGHDARNANLQARADAAAAWYAEHSIGRQVAVFQRLLAGPAGGQA